MISKWRRRRNWARGLGALFVLGGAVSYVPGLDTGLEFQAGGFNLSFVYCLLGVGLWKCDHTSRRVVLVLAHLPMLLLGWFSFELLSQALMPDYGEGVKRLGSVGEVVRFMGWGGLVFLGGYVPVYLLSDRRLKLLFVPSRSRKGFAKAPREQVRASKARWTVPALAGLSLACGLVFAALESREEVEFGDLAAFRREYGREIDFGRAFALECSRAGGFVSRADAVVAREAAFAGSAARAWLEPEAREGEVSMRTRYLVSPQGEADAHEFVTSLPFGYAFEFPVVYKGTAVSGDLEQSQRVTIYRDWVRAAGSDLSLQLVMVVPEE